jgi:hypothetical protein
MAPQQNNELAPQIRPGINGDPQQHAPGAGTQLVTGLGTDTFNAKLRKEIGSVKAGFRCEGLIVDFKEVFQDKVRVWNEGDNLSFLLTPLKSSGAHERAYLMLFDAGQNAENLLRFCQQELNMAPSEAGKVLPHPKSNFARKGYEEIVSLPLGAAAPWVREFIERNFSAPGAHISLSVRHAADTISVGVVIGFEPLQSAPSVSVASNHSKFSSLYSGLSTAKEYLGPLLGLGKIISELTQIMLCLPMAHRKGLWGITLDSASNTPGWGALSSMHLYCSGMAAALGTFVANVNLGIAEISRWAQWGDFHTLTKYGLIVLGCNLASLIYEWGYERYQLDKKERQAKKA